MHVSISSVLWNDARYLPEFFASIRSQTHKDITVRLFDNGSADGETVPYVLSHEPHWLAARSTKHVSDAVANNQLARLALERYSGDLRDHAVLFIACETVWHPSFLAEMVSCLERNPNVDVVVPKILRAFSERGDVESDAVQSDILESTGLQFAPGWTVRERGAGIMDPGEHGAPAGDVLPSPSAFLIRASALLALRIDRRVWDERYVSSWDVNDFCFRVARLGLETQYVSQAVLHRYRGFAEHVPESARSRTGFRLGFGAVRALWSRDRMLFLWKNGSWMEGLRYLVTRWILDVGACLVGSLIDRKIFRACVRLLVDCWHAGADMQEIRAHGARTCTDLRKKFQTRS